MLRQLSRATGMLAVAATFALPAARAGAERTPARSSSCSRSPTTRIGKDHADYDGMSEGVQDLLITDLASNAKIRLVDRARLQELLAEQNLAKTGVSRSGDGHSRRAHARRAVRDHRRLHDRRQDADASRLARRSTWRRRRSTTRRRCTGKADDVLGLIAQLSSKVDGNLNLAPKPGAAASRRGRRSKSGAGTVGGARSVPGDESRARDRELTRSPSASPKRSRRRSSTSRR